MVKTVFSIIMILTTLFWSAASYASPGFGDSEGGYTRGVAPDKPSRDFKVSSGLRARVNFWKDIFTVYGKYQSVIHHREYPQIVYDVLDFGPEAEQFNPVQLDLMRRKALNSRIEEIKDALIRLSRNERSASSLEDRIVEVMDFLPGGPDKYARAVREDLVRSQTGIKEKFEEAIARSGRYLPLMEKIFRDEFGLPIELTRLPFVESSFDYTAYSSVGAAGIWQFMPKTARLYMKVGALVDERRDPIESTRAAARYLRDAYERLGSWPLAVVSYNHGVGGVMQKVRRYGTSDITQLIEAPGEQAFGFASTNFYPSFLAAIEVYANYRKHFPAVEREAPLKMTSRILSYALNIGALERNLGISRDQLRRYNYALNEKIWEGRAPIPAGYKLKVPADLDSQLAFLSRPDNTVGPEAPAASNVYGGSTYRVRKGDSLKTIGRHYGVSVAELKALNALTSDQIRVGQLLKISPKAKSPNLPQKVKIPKSSPPSAKLNGNEFTYTVRPGDTLHSLAREYGLSVEAIKSKNNLRGSSVRVGQGLKLERR